MKSGYCGMGCPIDAKQSMLVTYLPDAVGAGARVVSRCRVDKLVVEGGAVERAECSVIGDDGYNVSGKKLTVTARRFVLAAGGIGTPSILIRSGLGGGMVGRRTFLHPVVGTRGVLQGSDRAVLRRAAVGGVARARRSRRRGRPVLRGGADAPDARRGRHRRLRHACTASS